MTISEALLLKKPIVATNLSVFMEQIEHRENGLLVPFDATKFADAIIRLINSPDLMQKMAGYSKEYPFSIKNVCQQFDKLINS
jgi:glycosyltransferase involved in cell wall biosynthesis